MNAATRDLLIAGDIGGTSARIAVGPAGPLPDAVVGPGANLRSSGDAAIRGIAATISTALEGLPGSRVRRVVLAISGAGPARHAEVLDAVRAALVPLGIAGDAVEVIDDLTVAFLSGGIGSDGLLLLAGTGAAAAHVENGRITERIDGMGWLLGDVGSAVWIGRAVLQAVARDLDGRGEPTALTALTAAELGIDLRDAADAPGGDLRQALIRAVDPLSPAQWGAFAPLAARALPDPVAASILAEAAAALLSTADRLDPGHRRPVVLAGSVLTSPGPVRERITAALERAGHPRVALAGSGLSAAWEAATSRP